MHYSHTLTEIKQIPDKRLLSKSEFNNELGDGLHSTVVGGEGEELGL